MPVFAIHIWAASAPSNSKLRWHNEIGDRRKTVTSPDFLYQRGIDLCLETLQQWSNCFGPIFAGDIRRSNTGIMVLI